MPQHGAQLFADMGEQDGFLDTTDPRDGVFTEPEPKVVQEALAAEDARDAGTVVPSGDKLPSGVTTFDNDAPEEAAFESQVDVDQAVTKAGDEHAAAFKDLHISPSQTTETAPTTAKQDASAGHSLFADDTSAFDIGDQGHAHGQSGEGDVSVKQPEHTTSAANALFGDDTSRFTIGEQDDVVTSSTKPPSAAKSLFGDDTADFNIGGHDTGLSTVSHIGVAAAAVGAAGGAAALLGKDSKLDPGEQEQKRPKASTETGTDPKSHTSRAKDQSDHNTSTNDSLQSMFGGPDTTSDWLVDTSVDDSLNLGRNDMVDEVAESNAGADDIDSQVPQGWYDETGEWNWYTDEEREQVRISMFGEGSNSNDIQPAAERETSKSDSYAPSTSYAAPSSAAGQDTNPYAPAAAAAASPYAPAAVEPNPYAPSAPAVATGSYFPQQQAASGLFTPGFPQVAGYAPAAVASPYAPGSSAPAPYAAQPSAYNPYAPSAQPAPAGYGQPPATSTSTPPVASTTSAKQPGPPKRMKSTAYDPPFIKQKSVARPPSRGPVGGIEAFAPSPFAAPPTTAPSAPPPGPPKRTKTSEQVPSVPITGSQSEPAVEVAHSYPSNESVDHSQPDHQYSYSASNATVDPYAPDAAPPLDPYAPAPHSPMNPYNLAPLQKAEEPVNPPKRPSTASSTHPPKPTSFDPPLRPTLSRPSSRHAQRPNFAPPPPAGGHGSGNASAVPPVPDIPAEFAPPPPKGSSRHASPAPNFAPPPAASSPPPRGPSRGGSAANPMFEAPPVAAVVAPPRNTGSPPSHGATASTALHAPPRIASPLTAPPRVTSPLRNEITQKVRQSLSLHEEFDPEGGAGEVWDEDSTDISLLPPQHSTPPAPYSTGRFDSNEQETLQSDEEDRQLDTVDPYNPSHGQHDTVSVPMRSSMPYDPYNPGSQQPPVPSQKAAAAAVYSAVPTGSTHEYNPYGSGRRESMDQPAPTVYNPYAPSSSPKKNVQALRDSHNAYAPPGRSSNEYSRQSDSGSFTQGRQSSDQDEYNPYAPAPASSQQTRAAYVPSSHSASNHGAKADDYNPYGARTSPVKSFTSPAGLQSSLPSQPVYDPYAPTSVSKQKTADVYSPGLDAYGRTDSPAQANYFQSMGAVGTADSTYVPQQVLEQRPVSEDPLGRCNPEARNNPLAIFGFGGVLITSFPAAAEESTNAPSYGYASHRGLISIRPVADVVESSALGTSSVAFPGPLVNDPAVTKGAAGEKKRREAVLAYLSARAEEIERGLPYLKSSASRARREEEGKLVIVRTLAAAIEGDGKLLGT